MWTHVLISFDENVENNLIFPPPDQSKKSHDLSSDQVATEPLHCALCTALSSPGLVTVYWYWHPPVTMNTCVYFFGWKVWTSHLRTNQGRVLICWSSQCYDWACPRDGAVFQTCFPASSLFFLLQKSKSTKRYRGPRLNEWLNQDLLIKLLLGLSMCWRWGRFFQLLSSPQPCSAAIFKIVTR